MKVLAMALLCCILFTACGSGTDSGTGGEHDHAAHKPTLDVRLEMDGDQVTVTVLTDMTISAEHYGQARQAGEGHIHMYLDNDPKITVDTPNYVFSGLAPGKHTLKVSLHNNDHTPYDVTQTREFEIE